MSCEKNRGAFVAHVAGGGSAAAQAFGGANDAGAALETIFDTARAQAAPSNLAQQTLAAAKTRLLFEWMKRSGALPRDQNFEDAKGFAAAFAAVDRCPKPVVACVRGAARGGGAGLVAVADAAIAAKSTVFGFPEVKLGIVPAAISPYVITKIGWSHARKLFLTGERFDADTALRIGLVHEVVADAELDAAVARTVAGLLTSGPEALVRVKRLLKGMNALAPDGALLDLTARTIADARASAEAQEGFAAFLEKRKPAWAR